MWESAYFVPALTTIGFDKAELARTAIDLLAARIADPTRPPETVTLPVHARRARQHLTGSSHRRRAAGLRSGTVGAFLPARVTSL